MAKVVPSAAQKASSAGSKVKKNKKSEVDEDVNQDQKLQAVLFADSFTRHFRPISLEIPKALVPLVNEPMIIYTIEMLISSGVKELFIFCVSHADKIHEYIESRHWAGGITVKCINSYTCLSIGDALRELDTMGIIRSDPFVLVRGDVISNVDLSSVIELHKTRRQKDRSCIMTALFKEVGYYAGIRSIQDELVLAVDRSGQIVWFEDNTKEIKMNIPLQIIQNFQDIEFRNDLLDCSIDICSPEVLLQFSDNFDYQDIRQHFVHNEVVNLDLGNKIFAHILTKEYAARVIDPRTYYYISKDILHRWVYPFVPDSNFWSDTEYKYQRRWCYRDNGVTLSRSVKIGNEVVLATGVEINDNCVIEGSIFGKGCKIGSGVKIYDSIIWDKVVIEDNVTINSAIICSGVIIKKDVTIERGCILSFGVVIGNGVKLSEFSRITKSEKKDENTDYGGAFDSVSYNQTIEQKSQSSQKPELQWNSFTVGDDGQGFLWRVNEDQDDDENDVEDDTNDNDVINDDNESHTSELLCHLNRKAPRPDKIKSQSIGFYEAELWKKKRWTISNNPTITFSSDSESDNEMGTEKTFENNEQKTSLPTNMFEKNVQQLLKQGFQRGDPMDSLILELNCFKLAQNKTFIDIVRSHVKVILELVDKNKDNQSELIKDVMFQFNYWKPMLLKITPNIDEKLTVIHSIEEFLINPEYSNLAKIFRYILHHLYNQEILSKDALDLWISERHEKASLDTPEMKLFNSSEVQEFISWLEQSDSDDDNSDDDDDDDDDNEKDNSNESNDDEN